MISTTPLLAAGQIPIVAVHQTLSSVGLLPPSASIPETTWMLRTPRAFLGIITHSETSFWGRTQLLHEQILDTTGKLREDDSDLTALMAGALQLVPLAEERAVNYYWMNLADGIFLGAKQTFVQSTKLHQEVRNGLAAVPTAKSKRQAHVYRIVRRLQKLAMNPETYPLWEQLIADVPLLEHPRSIVNVYKRIGVHMAKIGQKEWARHVLEQAVPHCSILHVGESDHDSLSVLFREHFGDEQRAYELLMADYEAHQKERSREQGRYFYEDYEANHLIRSLLRINRVSEALEILDQVPGASLDSKNIHHMVSAILNSDCLEKAEIASRLIELLRGRSLYNPDRYQIDVAMYSKSFLKLLDEVLAAELGKAEKALVHLIVEIGRKIPEDYNRSLVLLGCSKRLAKQRGYIALARRLFEEGSALGPDVVPYRNFSEARLYDSYQTIAFVEALEVSPLSLKKRERFLAQRLRQINGLQDPDRIKSAGYQLVIRFRFPKEGVGDVGSILRGLEDPRIRSQVGVLAVQDFIIQLKSDGKKTRSIVPLLDRVFPLIDASDYREFFEVSSHPLQFHGHWVLDHVLQLNDPSLLKAVLSNMVDGIQKGVSWATTPRWARENLQHLAERILMVVQHEEHEDYFQVSQIKQAFNELGFEIEA